LTWLARARSKVQSQRSNEKETSRFDLSTFQEFLEVSKVEGQAECLDSTFDL